jgi:hypothetical protein
MRHVTRWGYAGPMACCGPLVLVTALWAAGIAAAQTPERPRLNTNQSYLEGAMRATTLDVADPIAVFAFVLDNLPDRVKVYPTENYYYFTFVHKGVPYAGNIRLDASNRDEGKVSFGYYEDYAPWKGESPITFRLLDAAEGVKLEKVERLVYRLTRGAKSVVFELNDLSQVKPPPTAMGADETFIGPIFDESGIRFFLIYHARLKIFHYVLDETVPVADGLFPTRRTDRLMIGKRTGFAFYRDHRLDRMILVGVFLGNAVLNNYFDGPFDQLPDNFIEGETLRQALLQVDPKLRGKIDRFGAWPGGEERYMIAPYMFYEKEQDLDYFHQCAASKKTPARDYYRCFSIDASSVQLDAPPGAPKKSTKVRKRGPAGRPTQRR